MDLGAIRFWGTKCGEDGISGDADDRRRRDDQADRSRPKRRSGIGVVVEAVPEPETASETENDAENGAARHKKCCPATIKKYTVLGSRPVYLLGLFEISR